jgi:hypothetical protein
VKRLSRTFTVAALALALGACERDHIEITIEPQADGSFVRTLRLWRVDENAHNGIKAPSKEFVEAAKPHYMDPLAAKDATVVFRNTFYKMPQDVALEGQTNAGGYTLNVGTFGRVGHYRERRPGRADHAAAQQEIASSVATLTTLLATMARQQLQDEQGVEQLAKAIEGKFRRDLQDLASYLATTAATGQPVVLGKEFEDMDRPAVDRLFGMLSYVLQFAEERGYLKTRDFPRLFDEEFLRGRVFTLVAKHMGRPLDDALRAKLLTLSDGERWEAAGKQALQAIGLTELALRERVQPLTALGAVKMFGTEPLLHYVLVLPEDASVIATNGRAEEDGNKVRWTDELDGRLVAQLFHAMWATPDAAAQRKHLGRIAVKDLALMQLTLWEASLAPEPRKRWVAAVAALDPNRGLRTQLEAIRIEQGEGAGQPHGADVLIKALGLD